jgi:hypothetical protein
MPIDETFTVDGRSLVTTRLVETGFYRGATVKAALAAGFAEVYTVDVDYTAFACSIKMFYGDRRVHTFHGSSPDVLPRMLDPLVPTLVYLDGHFMGLPHERPDAAYGECPLLAELAVVTAVPWKTKPVVVVDDVPMFRRPWATAMHDRFSEIAWPELVEIKAALPGYEFRETGHVLYCFPKE